MAIPGLTVTGTTTAPDGFGMLKDAADVPLDTTPSYLQSDENRTLLGKLENWWAEARDAHAENRREQMIDADYVDMIQWRADEAAVLTGRGQAPLSTPLLKQVMKWLTGTERRTRIDWDVLPRKDADVELANVKKQVLKWVSDVNGTPWERSLQFESQATVGIGWMEDCINRDAFEEGITTRYQDWKEMWWDPYSRSNTLRDCRYVIRAKFLDLDYAISMMPDQADELTAAACDTLDSSMEVLSLETTLPMMFYGLEDRPTPTRNTGALGTFGSHMMVRRPRKRVLVLETWFKKANNTPLLVGDGADDQALALDGKTFNPKDAEHQQALADGVVTLVDGVTEEIWMALWTPGRLLRVNRSPYKHNKYPFTPAWASRRHRDGMPYGVPRESRDTIDELNKRKSKILFDLSTSQVYYESDAMDEADESNNLDETKRPDGEIRLNPGGLNKIKIDRGTDRIQPQIAMLDAAKQEIYEASGVTRENTGTSTGDQSGRAILAKQQQGAVVTAPLFDNYRQAIQESGQKTLSNCEQFLTAPKLIRILGPDGAFKWVTINQPNFDPLTGDVVWNNDITASQADFVVDETDFRETVRMAMSEMLFELIGRMPPNVAMSLLDVAVEMTDLPNKTALAQRIRQVTGQVAPGETVTPKAAAAKQAAEQQQAEQAASAKAAQDAKTRLTGAQADAAEARARLDTTKAQHQAVLGKSEAMNAAGKVASAPALAPAADRIWDPSQAFPMPPNQFTTAQ
jgi:hypothetical protein